MANKLIAITAATCTGWSRVVNFPRTHRMLIVFFVLFINSAAFSQMDTDPFKPVEIVPNTPDIAALTKNAHASVSLHTGAISQNIPLLTFVAKRLNVPISISYNSNGIKVDQVSSIVGLGWSLNTGGFISRTVLGRPDENVSLIDAPSESADPVVWDKFVENLVASNADNQPDIFTFSVEGNTGTFIIESQVIRKLDENNLKIEGNPTGGFVITTPKGVRYIFHDVEMVKTMNNCETGGGSRTFVSNSWLLSKIEHPLGEYILFEYQSKTYAHSSSVVQTVARITDPRVLGVPQTFPFKNCATTQHNMGQFLTRIFSSFGGSVDFQYQDREDIPGSFRLENIFVKEGDDLLKTIKFNHSYSSVTSTQYDSQFSDSFGKRLFLGSLNITGQNNEKENYSFAYINKNSLPPRLSYSKDRFGYFNGKNNLSLIPKPESGSVTAAQLSIPGFGDRTPNSTYAQIGLLNRISFPSGGVDSILFEPHMVTDNSLKCSQPALFSVSGESMFKATNYFTGSFSITCAQNINLHFACTAIGDVDYDNQYYVTTVNVFDANQNLVYAGSAGKNEVKDFLIGVSPQVYSVTLSVKGPALGNCEAAFLNFNSAANLLREVGGLRVKEIMKMDRNEVKEVISYDYTTNGIEAPIVADPMPFYNSTFLCYFPSVIGAGPSAYYNEYMSFSFFDFPQYSGISVGYDNVVERFGRNAENGSIAHRFTNFIDKTADIVKGFLIPGAPLFYDGRKSGQEFYTSFQDSDGKVKKEIWKYYSDKQELSRNKTYYIGRNRSSALYRSVISPNLILGVDVNKFELATRCNKLDSLITNVYSENNGQTSKLVEKDMYDYGNLSHLLTTKQQRITSDGKKMVSNISYPDDYPLGELSIDNMKSNYLKEFPIEFTTYAEKNGVKEILSGQLINYLADGKGKIGSIMSLELGEPLLLSKFKFSNKILGQAPSEGPLSNFEPSGLYKTKISYNDYDANGNPLQVSQQHGILISYLWGGAGRYLIAEIKNATSGSVKNAIGGPAVIEQLNSAAVSDLFIQQKMRLLRQNLLDAQITSYTHKPTIGVTSTTDAKGMTSDYEYDGLQRLKYIKDQNGNIVKSYDYHYKP